MCRRKLKCHLHIGHKLLHHRAVLCYLLQDGILAVKIHHFQAHNGLICQLRVKESHFKELQRQFVLADLCIDILFLCGNLNVKYRQSHSLIATNSHLLLGCNVAICVGDILFCTVLTQNAEMTGHVVKLTNQLNAKLHNLAVSPIRCHCRISATLAGSLLKRCDTGCRCNTRRCCAGAGFCVTGCLPQLVNGAVKHGDIVAVQGVMLNLSQCCLVHVAADLHQRLLQIQKLLFIHIAVNARKISGNSAHTGIFHKCGFQNVNLRLRIAAKVNVTISTRATFYGVKNIKYIRI